MTSHLPDTVEIYQGIPSRLDDVAGLGGDSHIDDQGRWVAQLDVVDGDGGRMISLLEGDTFELAGATWQVSTIYEPRVDRRHVATLTRVG
jgi:gamma-glutamylcysteine synthetase